MSKRLLPSDMSPTAIDRELKEIAGVFMSNRDMDEEARLELASRQFDLSFSRRKRLVSLQPVRHLRRASF
jgi:hypothetical protein